MLWGNDMARLQVRQLHWPSHQMPLSHLVILSRWSPPQSATLNCAQLLNCSTTRHNWPIWHTLSVWHQMVTPDVTLLTDQMPTADDWQIRWCKLWRLSWNFNLGSVTPCHWHGGRGHDNALKKLIKMWSLQYKWWGILPVALYYYCAIIICSNQIQIRALNMFL